MQRVVDHNMTTASLETNLRLMKEQINLLSFQLLQNMQICR